MAVGNHMDRRAQIVRVFTLLGGVYFFLYFILPESVVAAAGISARHEAISNGFIAIGVMAIGLGLFNLVSAHGSRLVFRKKGWAYSLALLAGLISMVAVTYAQWRENVALTGEIRRAQIVGEFAQRIADDAAAARNDVPPLHVRIDALKRYARDYLVWLDASVFSPPTSAGPLKEELRSSAEGVRQAVSALDGISGSELSPQAKDALSETTKSGARLSAALGAFMRHESSSSVVQNLYKLLYEGIFNQLGAAMFALLGVYIAAAAYRAFRIRTIESALMMTAAVVVMLGQISLGRMISDQLPELRQWLLEVPNSAAFRAIRLGAAVAGLILAIRMWLSIESKSFSAGKK